MKQTIFPLFLSIVLICISCQREAPIIDYELDEVLFPNETEWDIETVAPCGLGYDYKVNILEVVEHPSFDPETEVLEVHYSVENIGIGKGPDFIVVVSASGTTSWWASTKTGIGAGSAMQSSEVIWIPKHLLDRPSILVRLSTNNCDVDEDNNAVLWRR